MEHTPDDEPRQGSGRDARHLASSMDRPPRRAQNQRMSCGHTKTRRKIKDATLSVVPLQMRRTGEHHALADRAAALKRHAPAPLQSAHNGTWRCRTPDCPMVKIRRVGNNMNKVTIEATDCGLQRIERYLRDARVGTSADALCEDRSRAERADRKGPRQGGVDKWNHAKDDGTAG